LSKSLSGKIEREIRGFNGLLLRNKGKSLVGRIIVFFGPLMGKMNRSNVKMACYFGFKVFRLLRSMGPKGTVLYLKACHVLLMQSVALDKVKDLGPLKIRVKRSRSGIPLLVPVLQRRLLLSGDAKVMRFWSSLFSIYRIIDFPGDVNLSSITEPGFALPRFLGSPMFDSYQEVLHLFWHHLDIGKWCEK
jgi:hypothetical protein